MVRALIPGLVVAVLVVPAASTAFAQLNPNPNFRDTAVIPAFRALEPAMTHFTRIARVPIDEIHDILVVRGGAYHGDWGRPGDQFWWEERDLLGVFLAVRDKPDLVYALSIERGELGGSRPVLIHADSGSLTLDLVQEKGIRLPRRTLFFDVRAKALSKVVDFIAATPIGVVTDEGAVSVVFSDGETFSAVAWSGGVFSALDSEETERLRKLLPAERTPDVWYWLGHPPRRSEKFGPNGRFHYKQLEKPGWGWKPPGIIERADQGEIVHLFPESSSEKVMATREDVRSDRPQIEGPIRLDILEEVGAYQIVGDRFWFAKSFYGGEGWVGVGGFGYFDPPDRTYTLIEPPEMARWSSSAILVEESAVWLGLAQRGEYGDHSVGLLRWDRAGQQVELIEEKTAIVSPITRCGDGLCFGLDGGLVYFAEGRFEHCIVVARSSDGWRVLPRRN